MQENKDKLELILTPGGRSHPFFFFFFLVQGKDKNTIPSICRVFRFPWVISHLDHPCCEVGMVDYPEVQRG